MARLWSFSSSMLRSIQGELNCRGSGCLSSVSLGSQVCQLARITCVCIMCACRGFGAGLRELCKCIAAQRLLLCCTVNAGNVCLRPAHPSGSDEVWPACSSKRGRNFLALLGEQSRIYSGGAASAEHGNGSCRNWAAKRLQNPVDIAHMHGHDEVVKVLEQAMRARIASSGWGPV